jgi:hypothetical protein
MKAELTNTLIEYGMDEIDIVDAYDKIMALFESRLKEERAEKDIYLKINDQLKRTLTKAREQLKEKHSLKTHQDIADYYQVKIYKLKSQIKEERTETNKLRRLYQDVKCKCLPEMEIIGCGAGDYCIHSKSK